MTKGQYIFLFIFGQLILQGILCALFGPDPDECPEGRIEYEPIDGGGLSFYSVLIFIVFEVFLFKLGVWAFDLS